MVRIVRRYKTFVSTLAVLGYLLIGSGVGNALLWCQESETDSHLEYNLAGQCRIVCLPSEGDYESGRQVDISPVLRSLADDCQDTRVFLSHAPAPSGKKLLPDTVSPGSYSSNIPSANYSTSSFLTRLNLIAQPPPSQALVSLRTVVLLN
ncbi:MAG: hypothetical protein RQ722_04090 [Desulfuromonadales bacterium]|nr:hypothetical protein [Desulfuromonadales bacterium]